MNTRIRHSIDQEAWPALDRRLWEAALKPAEFLDRPGAAAHWRPATVRQAVKAYGLWLFHLGATGSLDPDLRPDLRVTEATLSSFIASLRDRKLAPVTIASRVTELCQVLRVIVPDGDVDRLRAVARQLTKTQTPVRNKAARVIHSRTIRDGALAFLDRIDEVEALNDTVRATLHRDALIVALLACCPIRLRNLTMIVIGRHLARLDDGFGCRFDPDETKEHRPLAFPLPKSLVPHLERYLASGRPKLLRGRTCDRLWVGVRAKPISGQTIYYAVLKMTERLFGRPLNPHLFRDSVATSIAIEAPEHIRIVAPILGHASLRTSEQHYNQAQMIDAGRAHQQAILNLMQEAEE